MKPMNDNFSEFLASLISDLQKMKPGDVMTIEVDEDEEEKENLELDIDIEEEEDGEELPFDDECESCDNMDCPAHPCHDCCGDGDEDEEEDPDPEFILELPWIDHIIFNDPATIVFWNDGTKTVVKCMQGEKFERYAGFAAACMKKLFGSTSNAKHVMNLLDVAQHVKEEPPAGKPEAPKKPEQEKCDKKPGPEDIIFTIGLLEVLKRLAEDKKEQKDETPAE